MKARKKPAAAKRAAVLKQATAKTKAPSRQELDALEKERAAMTVEGEAMRKNAQP